MSNIIRDEPEGGVLSDILKNLAIGGTGIATGIAGTIPSVLSMLSSGAEYLGSKMKPNPVEKFLGLDPGKGIQSRAAEVRKLAEYATPEALRGYAEDWSGGYLKPETETQEVSSEVGQDIGSVLAMGGGPGAAAKLTAIGNASKQAAKLLGASEEVTNLVKAAGMIASPSFGFSKIGPLAKKLYKSGESAIKPGSMAPAVGIKSAAKKVITEASKGSAPYKNSVVNFAKKIMGKTKYNKLSAKELWTFKKDLNDAISRGTFATKKEVLFKPLEKAIRSNLKQYGLINKEFGYAQPNADVLYSITKKLPFIDEISNKFLGLKDSGLSNFFRKAFVLGRFGLKGLFTKGLLGSFIDSGEAILRSPAYRKASMQLAKAAAKNSIPTAVKSLKELSRIKKEFDSGDEVIISPEEMQKRKILRRK